MTSRTLILASTLALLLVPAAAAHAGTHASAETAPPLGECAGAVDVLCFHWDCNAFACIHLFCPVYIGHNGGASFGCTPH